MLKPREEEILNAVAEVLRSGLSDVRRDMDARLSAIEKQADTLQEQVKGLITESMFAGPIEALQAQVKELAERPAPDYRMTIAELVSDAVASLPPAESGKSVTVDDVAPMIRGEVQAAVAALPKPKDGESVTLNDVQPMIEQTVKEAVAAIPLPDLAPLTERIAAIEARPDVVESHDRLVDAIDVLSDKVEQRFAASEPRIEEIEKLRKIDYLNLDNLHERVMKLEAKPPPEKDKDAEPVNVPLLVLELAPTVQAEVAKAVDAIPKPKDGTSITVDDVRGVLEAEFAKWAMNQQGLVLDMAQRAIDRMPKPENGKDGFSLTDFEFIALDERTFEMRFTQGDLVKSVVHRIPAPIDRGVWKVGEKYQRGDGVTWGGSWFIAQVDDPQGKPLESKDWRQAVKKGRDGRDGDKGLKGDDGKPGPRGRDLTVLMPDGSRA